METQVWDLIVKSIAGGGVVAALLFGALYWLNRNNTVLLAELKAERESKIKLLEAESAACKADRVELHKQCAILKDQIIEIYRSRDQKNIIEKQQAAQSQS